MPAIGPPTAWMRPPTVRMQSRSFQMFGGNFLVPAHALTSGIVLHPK